MKIGDMVKMNPPVLQGSGIILDITDRSATTGCLIRADLMWTSHGKTKFGNWAMQYMEVVSASR